MSEKIKVPTLGESVTEATVSKWLKSQGDKVIADEPIVELETDKVNVEVPSPTNGVLGSIAVKEGETVNVGSLLGTVDSSLPGKQKNINDSNKLAHVNKELDFLNNTLIKYVKKKAINKYLENLININSKLWKIDWKLQKRLEKLPQGKTKTSDLCG